MHEDSSVNAELALLFSSFFCLYQSTEIRRAAEVSTPLQECPRRRDRISIDRSSIRPYGRFRSGTRVYRPWVLELMDPYGKYLYWRITSCVKLLHNQICPLGPLAFDPVCFLGLFVESCCSTASWIRKHSLQTENVNGLALLTRLHWIFVFALLCRSHCRGVKWRMFSVFILNI